MTAIARRSLIMLAGVAIAAAGSVVAVRAQPAGDPFARFYAGPSTDLKIGTFPGTLVCLNCDLGGLGAKQQCGAVGHRHALKAEDGSIHPLIPATSEVLVVINSDALHGQPVKVHGKYYQSLGAILVDQVEPAS